jgi:hypothetical protein
VQADVVHGGDGSIHVGYTDDTIAAGKFFGFVEWGEIRFGSQLNEVSHGSGASEKKQAELCSAWTGEGARPYTNLAWARAPVPTRALTPVKRGHFGCRVWAIITWRLKLSTMFSSKRTSVGFLARVIVSILSCSLSKA